MIELSRSSSVNSSIRSVSVTGCPHPQHHGGQSFERWRLAPCDGSKGVFIDAACGNQCLRREIRSGRS